MSKLEKELENDIKNWCDQNNVLFIKFTPMGERGWPDRIAILPSGKHVWIELKREGKALPRLQGHRIRRLRRQNADAVFFDNPVACINYLKRLIHDGV